MVKVPRFQFFETRIKTVSAASIMLVAATIGETLARPDPALGNKPGESFRDCPECPEMVVVPAGKFMMGSPATDKYRVKIEVPQHEVTIARPYAVGKFEIMFSEWDACVKDSGCQEQTQKDRWGRGNQPLINVSWTEAQDYLAWIQKLTGRKYRLLSEAEWEYAARAGSATAYPWGADIGIGNANCAECGSQWDEMQTAPVGSFKPNSFGLFDMHGNVWEWVQDCSNLDHQGAPIDGTAREAGDCGQRVVRGGSWYSDARNLRSASRGWEESSSRSRFRGFRLARTL